MVLLILFLWLFYIDKPYVEEEEGIEVAFNEPEEMEEPKPEPAAPAAAAGSAAPSAAHEETTTQPAKVTTTVPSKPVITQVDPSVAAAKAAREEAERIARAEEAARKAAEAAAKAKKAEEDAKKAKAQSAMAGLFGSGSGTGTGSTNTAGSGSAATKNPVGSGSGSSNGASWSLAGRGLSGSLSKPAYGSNAEGTVVVAIRVDQNGNVVSATKGAGTDTADQTLINAAIEAAKKAKFTAGDGVAVGSITYVFRLN